MRCLCLVLVALLGVAFAKNVPSLKEEEEVALAFIECVRKALDTGLPDAGIPPHNPFVVTRNLTLPIDLAGITGFIKMDHVLIEDIVSFVITGLTGTYTDATQNEIVYDYQWHYDQMRVNGEYEADLVILDVEYDVAGTFNFTFKDLLLAGQWDMTSDPKWLNNFTVTLSGIVDFLIAGLGDEIDPVVSAAVSEALTALLAAESSVISEFFSTFLLQRFNDLWFAEEYWYRTDAIIANCHAQ